MGPRRTRGTMEGDLGDMEDLGDLEELGKSEELRQLGIPEKLGRRTLEYIARPQELK